MNTIPESPPRRPWGRYVFLVGILFLGGLIGHFGWENLLGLIRGASVSKLGLMALLIVAGFWIRAWKWHYVLGPGQEGISIFFLSKTAGNFTPGRAGEFAPLLLRRHRNARVTGWIGLDRIVEVCWTLGLGFLGAASIGLVPWWSVALGGVVALASAVVGWSALGKGWLRFGDDRAPATWRSRVGRFINTVRDEVLLFGRKLPVILITTGLAKLSDIYAVLFLCSAFGYTAPFLLVCAARCAHALVSAIPVTPDATGVPFIAAAWCLNTYAEIPYDTLTAALGLEVLVINGILWFCFCVVSAFPKPIDSTPIP